MVRADERRELRQRFEARKQVGRDAGMSHDQRPLLRTQPTALLEDGFRDVELAQVLKQCRVPDAPLSAGVKPEIVGEPLSQLGVLSSPAMHRLAKLDSAGEREHGGLLHLPRLVEKSRRLEGRRRLVRKRHDGGQVGLFQPRAEYGDRPGGFALKDQRRRDQRVEVEQFAQLAGVADCVGRQYEGHPPDQLIVVADVVGLQRRADLVKDGDAVEGQEVANLLPADELAYLGGSLERMAERHNEAFAVRRQLEQVRRQAGLGEPAPHRGKDRLAVQPL